jgi:hypothetical protein
MLRARLRVALTTRFLLLGVIIPLVACNKSDKTTIKVFA